MQLGPFIALTAGLYYCDAQAVARSQRLKKIQERARGDNILWSDMPDADVNDWYRTALAGARQSGHLPMDRNASTSRAEASARKCKWESGASDDEVVCVTTWGEALTVPVWAYQIYDEGMLLRLGERKLREMTIQATTLSEPDHNGELIPALEQPILGIGLALRGDTRSRPFPVGPKDRAGTSPVRVPRGEYIVVDEKAN